MRKTSVAHHHVGFQVEQQAQRIDVAAADGGPVVVHQRHLGVQKGGRVLKDAHAVVAHLCIQSSGGQRGNAVVDFALQQEAHAHTAFGGTAQRAAKALAGVEVGHRNVHPRLRVANGFDIAALNGAALAQVVAHQEGSPHRLFGLHVGCGRLGAQVAQQRERVFDGARTADQHLGFFAPVARQVGACPHRARGGMHRLRQRALHGHRKVQPRRVAPAVVHVVAVVDQVDAADKSQALITHTKLLVQPAQLPGLQPRIPAVERTKNFQLHGTAGKHRPHARQRGDGAKAVHHQVHRHTACGSPLERVGHQRGGRVVVKDVGGQPDIALRGVDAFAHAGEQCVATLQQFNLVAAHKARRWHGRPALQGFSTGQRHGFSQPRKQAPIQRSTAGGRTCAPRSCRAAPWLSCKPGRAGKSGRARRPVQSTGRWRG